jgi:hypothetical protein
MFGDAALERDGAHFVGSTLGWTHISISLIEFLGFKVFRAAF